MPSNLVTHALRTLEVDNVHSLKRRRLTVDANREGASEVHDMLESLEQLVPPVKEFVVGLELPRSSPEKSKTPWQMDLGSATVENSEADLSSKLGIVASRTLLGADNERRLKRMRDGDVKHQLLGDDYPVFVIEESNGLSIQKAILSVEDSCVPPDSKRPSLLKSVTSKETVQDIVGKDWKESGDYGLERSSIGVKNSSDNHGASSKIGIPAVHSCDRQTLHEYLSGSYQHSEGWSDTHGSRRKPQWTQLQGLPDNAEFAGNVGRAYRSAIDKRPAAALHPGSVGDGAKVQYCCLCGKIEDATSSLICDSCEEVFHMTCINARMKVVPQIDDWLCRPCKKKRRMNRESEKQGNHDSAIATKDWWIEGGVVGKVERDMQRMSNGKRSKVRIGPAYQVDVPEWRGVVEEVDLDDTLAEASYHFGQEVPLTCEEKQQEQELAEYNLANNIWPKGWLPVTKLPLGFKENWLQCTAQLFPEGQILPDGRSAENNTICGKWRRAPLGVESNDQWECSCAVNWDPRHSDCFVPQELSTQEIEERMKFMQIYVEQEITV